MSKRVVVYMSPWCYTSKDTQSALNEWGVPATFINIKEDSAAAARAGLGRLRKRAHDRHRRRRERRTL